MRRVLVLALLLGAFVQVACGDDDSPDAASTATAATSGSAMASTPGSEAGAGNAQTSVSATLTEFKVVLDKSQAPTGKVTFNAKNDGSVAHELVVVRSDLAPDKLPLDTTKGVVDEAKVKSIGEIEEFDAKTSKAGTFTLAPGKFIVFCNVPAHYAAGMHTAFTVQ